MQSDQVLAATSAVILGHGLAAAEGWRPDLGCHAGQLLGEDGSGPRTWSLVDVANKERKTKFV